MQDVKPLPKEIETMIDLAESDSTSVRRFVSMAYRLGRLDGMLDYAKVEVHQRIAPVSVAALEGAA